MAVRSVEDVEGSARQDVGRYAPVNGLQLYYEIHGQGRPLVLLHGGGSSLETTFGRIRPALAEHHRVVAIDLQAHGHTRDIDRPLTFEQDADDVAALLPQLQARMLGFQGFSETDLRAIDSPALVINGDTDVVRPEHAIALSRLLPRARLCIVPGGHGEAIGEITWPEADGPVQRLVTTLIADFLAS